MDRSRLYIPLAGRIRRKISLGHFGKDFIFIINNNPKLMDQSAHLSGENAQFVPGGIGNLYIQIPSAIFMAAFSISEMGVLIRRTITNEKKTPTRMMAMTTAVMVKVAVL